MSESVPIPVEPDSPAQRRQFELQARKQDESLAEYCRRATEQRVARELQSQRVDDLSLDTEFTRLADEIVDEVTAVTDADTQCELAYTVALWELLSSEYGCEERATAMEAAYETLADQFADRLPLDGENA